MNWGSVIYWPSRSFNSDLFPKGSPSSSSMHFLSCWPLFFKFLLPLDSHHYLLPYIHFFLFTVYNVKCIPRYLNSHHLNICYDLLETFNLKLTIHIEISLKETCMYVPAKNIKLHVNLSERIWSRLLSVNPLFSQQDCVSW